MTIKTEGLKCYECGHTWDVFESGGPDNCPRCGAKVDYDKN